jgi:ribose transport system substrate-binding protein
MSQVRPRVWVPLAAIGLIAVAYAYGSYVSFQSKSPPRIELFVGGTDPFWQIVSDGARDASDRYGVNLHVSIPSQGSQEQTKYLMQLDPRTVDGIAISPMEPDEQTRLLNELAKKVNLVTYDNDAPHSLRLCYIGANNELAGRSSARLVKDALPNGGKLALFIGDVERENARLRCQGFISELLDRQIDVDAPINTDRPSEGNGYTIERIYIDGSDPVTAKANAADAIREHKDLACLVGLYSYDGPMCFEAAKEAGKLGAIKIIAFDEDKQTLDGVAHGTIYGTVVQNPYQYGYYAIRMLVDLHEGTDASLPIAGGGWLFLPCTEVTRENLAAYRAKLDARLGRKSGE